MHDAKNATPGFQDVCSKTRATVRYYKRTPHATAKLHDIQKAMGVAEVELEVVRDVPTCYSSKFLIWNFALSLLCSLLPLVLATHLVLLSGRRHLSVHLS